MKRFMPGLALTAFVSIAVTLPAFAALKEGDAAPDFEARASLAGKEFSFSLKEQLKKGPVVVYFYPSAYTGGCNVQAKKFADNTEKFKEAGASIIGVSMDSIARLNDFSADPEYCGGKVPVASDADGKIAQAYDLRVVNREGMKDSRGKDVGHALTERTTFIVTPDGKVAATVGGVSPIDNVDKALAAVQKLSSKG